MTVVKGEIKIDPERKTVSVDLDNQSYCHDHFTHGLKRWLDEEIDLLRTDANKEEEE